MRLRPGRESRSMEVRYGPRRRTLLIGSALLGAGGLLGAVSAQAGAATLNTWSAAGTLGSARAGATATLLGNGQVLVVGGTTGTVATDTLATTAELYNPTTNAWVTTASGAPSVTDAVAAILPNGNVLIAGGSGRWRKFDELGRDLQPGDECLECRGVPSQW
jgi:hypothetical protein